MKGRSPERICAYCGRPASTRDHVPPKAFFVRPLPSDLITVPACLTCNQVNAREDEYVSTAILMRADIPNWPGAGPLVEKVIRGLNRDEASGLREHFIGGMQDVDVVDEGGAPMGKATIHTVDKQRLAVFVKRIIRGLFFKEFGQPVPARYLVTPSITVELNRDLLAKFIAMVASRPVRMLAGGAFAYSWAEVVDSPMSSVWLFSFFQRAPFAGLVRDSVAPSTRGPFET